MKPLTIVVAATLLVGACRTPPNYLAAEGALGPYSASAEAGGLVFLSGQIGSKRNGSFEDEVHSALDRVDHELARRDLGYGDCVAVTVYLTDMADYARFNAIYGERFLAPHPARVCVAVAALPAGARVEIQATAAR